METQSTLESVREYYGKVLQGSDDLKTSACCSTDTLAPHLRAIVSEIHSEVKDRFYGCGTPIPPSLEGCTVLDLGCGTGRDCFLLSKLVGPTGRVIGVDMTREQLAVAEKHNGYHAEKFGYREPNTRFVHGYIEDLAGAGIEPNSVDVIVSNCVVNLSPDKARVFAQAFRALKPGGELYYSDVFASRRVPAPLQRDPVLLGECLGGALYLEDFRRLIGEVGCADYRVVSRSPITLTDPEIVAKVGMIDFVSLTIRAFKLDLEDRCEDYGQVAYYQGTLPESPHQFVLDDHHVFKTGQPMLVCGNTADMVQRTRFAKHFRVIGEKTTHYGLFDCGPTPNALSAPVASGACC